MKNYARGFDCQAGGLAVLPPFHGVARVRIPYASFVRLVRQKPYGSASRVCRICTSRAYPAAYLGNCRCARVWLVSAGRSGIVLKEAFNKRRVIAVLNTPHRRRRPDQRIPRQ
jgi:hypothetical protein